MMFRHQEHLDRGIILFPLVPDKLHKPGRISVQIVAIKFQLIQCASEEVVPGIAESILQDHRPGTRKIAVQLDVIMLFGLSIAQKNDVRISPSFEGYDLEHIIP
jgi:hypothetical protein